MGISTRPLFCSQIYITAIEMLAARVTGSGLPGVIGGVMGGVMGGGRLGLGVSRVIPGTGQVRHRRVNIQKPHRPDFFRQKLLELSGPVWKEQLEIEELPQECEYEDRMEERHSWDKHINQLEKFYVEELVEMFEKSPMIAFFHSNPIKLADWRKAWQNGRRQKMELAKFSRRVGMAGLKGTQWENCLHFFMSFPGNPYEQPILFSPEVEPRKLITFTKKVPEFHLLGCVVYGRILSKAQISALVDLPDLHQQHTQLCALLNMQQKQTLSLLQSNQSNLSLQLDQYVKDQSPL